MSAVVLEIKNLTRRFGAFTAVVVVRTCMLVGSPSTFGLSLDYAVILLTTTVLVLIGARLYPRLAT